MNSQQTPEPWPKPYFSPRQQAEIKPHLYATFDTDVEDDPPELFVLAAPDICDMINQRCGRRPSHLIHDKLEPKPCWSTLYGDGPRFSRFSYACLTLALFLDWRLRFRQNKITESPPADRTTARKNTGKRLEEAEGAALLYRPNAPGKNKDTPHVHVYYKPRTNIKSKHTKDTNDAHTSSR